MEAVLSMIVFIPPYHTTKPRVNDEKISDKDNLLDPRELKEKGLAHVPEDRQRMGLVTDFKAYENLIFGYHDQEPYSKSSILRDR